MVHADSVPNLPQSPKKVQATVVFAMLTTAAIAWLSVYYLMSMGGMWLTGASVGMLVSLDPGTFLLFIPIWIVGMIAMMFPAMIPAISAYNGTLAKATRQPVFGSALFLAGYLGMYLLLGLVAYLALLLILGAAAAIPYLSNYAVFGAGLVLIATGFWQLTAAKNACLKRCISPLGFLITRGRQGFLGAFRMGAEHGYFCVGCCYLYMIVMLVVAGMSIPGMALLTIVITLEKTMMKGDKRFNWLVAAVFATLGALVWLFPNTLMII